MAGPAVPPVTLTLGPVAHGGHCVARHEGRVVFVRHGIPGEVVRAALTEYDDDARFWRADVTEVLEGSADRVPHFWPEADSLRAGAHATLPVGGAEFGHIRRERQRDLKAQVIREQLVRLGGLEPARAQELLAAGVEDVDAGTAALGWRTRTGFAVPADGRLGMHAHRSTAVLPVGAMPLAVPGINDLRLAEVDLTGLARVDVAAPANGSRPLVLLTTAEGLPEKNAGHAVRRVARELAGRAVPPSVAREDPATGTLELLAGRGWVAESAAGHDYRVSGNGFWQIHRAAPDVLAGAVLGALTGEGFLQSGAAVADLYAGAGLFTAPLADAVGATGRVLSVEGAPGTSRDARKNLHAAAQVEVRQGKVERVLAGQRHRFDAVVLDPPRAGAGKTVVKQLTAAGPRAIAYVACDPASFARDLGYFRAAGWTLTSLRAFDLYPHTHHVETLALLTPGQRQ